MVDRLPTGQRRSRSPPTAASMPGLRHGTARAPGDARTSPRTPAAGARRSTAEPRAIPAMARASGSGSASRKPSAGSRPSPAQSRTKLRGLARVTLVVHLRGRRLQPRTAAEAAGREPRYDRPAGLPTDRPVADRRGRSVGSCPSRPGRTRHDDHRGPRPRRDHLRGHAGRPRARVLPVHGLLHLGGVRGDGRGHAARDRPSCKTTARSRSRSPTTSATRRS